MPRLTFMLSFDCPGVLPAHVKRWMLQNLAEHAASEFGANYDPAFTDPPHNGGLIVPGGPVAGSVTETTDLLPIGGRDAA